MEEQVASKKHIYSKREAIVLYSFLFVWGTLFITGFDHFFKQHYFFRYILQASAYVGLYLLGRYIIANGVSIRNNSNIDSSDISKRMNDDISCGVSPYNYRNEINFNPNSPFNSSN